VDRDERSMTKMGERGFLKETARREREGEREREVMPAREGEIGKERVNKEFLLKLDGERGLDRGLEREAEEVDREELAELEADEDEDVKECDLLFLGRYLRSQPTKKLLEEEEERK
jgi:hypothetical protein